MMYWVSSEGLRAMSVAIRAMPSTQPVLMRLWVLAGVEGLQQSTMKSLASMDAPAMARPAREDCTAAKMPQKMIPPTQEGSRLVALKMVV